MIEVLQNCKSYCNKQPHGTKLTQNFYWKRYAFHESCFNVKRNKKLKKHDVTEVKCDVVKLFEYFAKLSKKSVDLSLYFLILCLYLFVFHSGLYGIKNEKDKCQNH